MTKPTDNEIRILLAEYQNCTSKVHSYSTLMWQTGAIFIAGLFILLSTVIQIGKPFLFIPTFLTSLVTLFYWQILYRRYRWYNRICFYRARAIEGYLKDNFKAIAKLPIDKFYAETIESWITSLSTCDRYALMEMELPNDIKDRPMRTYWIPNFIFVMLVVIIPIFAILRMI